MKASELVAAIQAMIAKHGDLEIVHEQDGISSTQIEVIYVTLESLPALFVIE
jgi:hypothetical protein